MARTVRDASLETRNARLKLGQQSEPYWRTISKGAHIGYYKGPLGGSWIARVRIKDKRRGFKYVKNQIGKSDDIQDADGITIFNFAQAQEKARQWFREEEQAALGHVPLAPLTVKQAAESYLAWFQEHRKGYRETYHAIHAHVLPALGDKFVGNITTKEIRDWLNNLAATPARKRTGLGKKQAYRDKPQTEDEKRARKVSANRTLAFLKAMLNRAFQDELVSDDTAWRRVKPFAKVDEPVVRFLTEAESMRLINASRPDFRQLVKGALFTGARYSELTNMKVQNVNLDTKLVHIPTSKSGRQRYIPLSAEGFDFFKSICVGKASDDLVFLKSDENPWGRNHHVRYLQDACKAARIEPDVKFHELRHTYASILAQAGADLLVISKLLGHSDTRITSRHYAHLCDKTLANAVQNFLPSFGHHPENKIKSIR